MADSDRHRRISELFLAAAEMGLDERAAYLDEACAGDLELRNRVEALLAHDETFTEEADDVLLGAVAAGLNLDEAVPTTPDPETVGAYRILRRIGEGGMGVVYLAEQHEPVQRTVALKLIKLGMQTSRVLGRFENERQALALMNHANIARVFDAGATAEGRPYFVMEYVQGMPLTAYCDRQRLGLTERLKLFIEVCKAVQHAHQKGIIHRDLKPSNILVMEQDGQPIPKIIDFGIAKATEQRRTERTVFTEAGGWIGTPEYMSPEQAGAVDRDIDTRSDVYSLGIVLYELLIGVLPLDERLLRRAAHDEIQRAIREVEPTRPSARLSTLGDETTEIARSRGTDRRALSRTLRGDLDWITLRALAKERSRRYDSASELAADIARHLADEPVEAGPPSAAYRLRKFARRNRGKMAAAVLVLVALLVGLVGEEIQRRRAVHHATVAEERFQRLMELTGLSDGDLANQFLQEAEGLWPARPETIPAIEDWLARVAALIGRRGFHQETLNKLREQALPYSSDDAVADRETHPKLDELNGLLEAERRLQDELARVQREDPATANPQYARRLERQIGRLTSQISELEKVVATRRTWRFEESEQQWQHERLHEVTRLIDRLADPDPAIGVVAGVRARLDQARTVHERTVDDRRAKWAEAIVSIADPVRSPAYRGLKITPQVGLVPLGQDPESGLWEFGYPQTGTLPERDDEGRLVLEESSGLVFVLIPGGTLTMGSDGETIGVELSESETTLRVDWVETGLFGDRLGLLEGDILASLNGEPLSTLADLNSSATTLRPGDSIVVTVLRHGELLELSARLPQNSAPIFILEDELPSRTVSLAPFFISKYEMTQGQWLRHAGSNPSRYPPQLNVSRRQHSLLHPVERVSWEDCRRVLSQLDLILPTEAQWEYAARGGTDTVWFTGDDPRALAGHGNIADRYAHENGLGRHLAHEPWLDDGYVVHSPIGHYAANPFGLHDIVGNVWEWCRDWYQSYAEPVRAGDGLSRGSPSGSRVNRGGSWRDLALDSRSSIRGNNAPDKAWFDLGIRPARPLQHDEPTVSSP